MKAVYLLSLPVCLLAAASVKAQLTETVANEQISLWYTHLTELNQSQPIEAMSTADRFTGLPVYQLAGVHFITGKDGLNFSQPNSSDFIDPSLDYCSRLNFKISSCASGLFNRACPYNDKLYDRCCDRAYTYTAASCTYPRTLSDDICGGKHRCYCNSSAFPFTSCNTPQIKGESCSDDTQTRYRSCVCPNNNYGQWGCKEYYATPCGHICKTPYPDNCHNRVSVSLPNNSSCSSHFYDCNSKCERWTCNAGYTDISSCLWMRCWVKF